MLTTTTKAKRWSVLTGGLWRQRLFLLTTFLRLPTGFLCTLSALNILINTSQTSSFFFFFSLFQTVPVSELERSTGRRLISSSGIDNRELKKRGPVQLHYQCSSPIFSNALCGRRLLWDGKACVLVTRTRYIACVWTSTKSLESVQAMHSNSHRKSCIL